MFRTKFFFLVSTIVINLNHCAPPHENLNMYVSKNNTLLRIVNQKIDLKKLNTIKNPETITMIDLSKTMLKVLDLNLFLPFKKLKKLWLNNNEVEVIIPLEENRSLPSLQFITLAHNRLTHFNSAWLRGCENLEELWLNNNMIKTIETKTILPNIREIHLNNNTLRFLNLSDYEAFPWLYVLNLGFNQIIKIVPSARKLERLEALFVNNNAITVLPSGFFKNIPSLKALYLQNNKIKTIDDHCFDCLVNLVQLFLQNNNIEVLSNRIFAHLQKLYILYLRNNKIYTLEPECFFGLNNLSVLDLAGNTITMSSTNVEKIITTLPHLRTLYLDNNKTY